MRWTISHIGVAVLATTTGVSPISPPGAVHEVKRVVHEGPGIPPEPDLPDDLRHGHRPPTGTSTQLAFHTRPVTCDFTRTKP